MLLRLFGSLSLFLLLGVCANAQQYRDTVHKSLLKDQPVKDAVWILDGSERALDEFKTDGQAPTIVSIADQPFRKAARVEVARGKNYPWGVTFAKTLHLGKARKGDVLFASFYVRKLSGGTDRETTRVFISPSGKNYYAMGRFAVGSEWKRIDMPMRATRKARGRDFRFVFALDHHSQVLEIGGVVLVNLGQGGILEKLPDSKLKLDYPGREPDAPWRKVAAERIEKYRKGNLTVNVRDANGRPVPGAKVKVEMQRHAFKFGCPVSNYLPLKSEAVQKKWKTEFHKLFNYGIAGTKGYEWQEKRKLKDKPVRKHLFMNLNWMDKHDIPYYCHVMIYRDKAEGSREQVFKKMRDERVVGMAKEILAQGHQPFSHDVINEACTSGRYNSYLMGEEGPKWFKAAREADPKALLFFNENGILDTRARIVEDSRRIAAMKTAKHLLKHGAPIDAISMQGHHKSMMASSPAEVILAMDWLHRETGLLLHISEWDFPCNYDTGAGHLDGVDEGKDLLRVTEENQRLQADYTRDFLTAAFSHPKLIGFIHYGLWDEMTWKKSAGLFDSNWKLKPNGEAFRKLVRETWWTNATDKTDRRGSCQVRGFYGDYRITVANGGKTATVNTKHLKSGSTVTVTLK